MFRDDDVMIWAMARNEQPRHGMSASRARTHLSVLRRIPDVLAAFGVPAGPVLESVGLKPEDFDDPMRNATFDHLDRLLGACVECTGCPHFGLLAGQSINLHSLGLTGRLASTASRVGEALHDLTTYFVLHESGGVTHLAVSNGTATFSYGIQAAIRHTDQAYDIATVVLLNIMRQLCGPGWQPSAVLLPRRRPENVRPYREALQAPIRFDSVQASVQFPTEWLDKPVVGSDPLLHAVLQEHVAAASDRADPLLENEVRRAIRRSLTSGRISRESIARQLGLHPRTMVRRLTENGLSFQALLDETRAQVARQLLHDTRMRVSRIATSLGYRDPTVFSRAFRRWTGHTPRAFREALPRNG